MFIYCNVYIAINLSNLILEFLYRSLLNNQIFIENSILFPFKINSIEIMRGSQNL